MIPGSRVRRPAYPIDALFADRWSPRAMSGGALSQRELMLLFEAARWAPSSANFQPWRMLYALRDGAHWPRFLGLLNDGNRRWCERGAALVLFISRRLRDDGRPAITHAFDTGAAWENLALQASVRGLVAHAMQGFDYQRARHELAVPADYDLHAMAVIGLPGDAALLSEEQRARERPNERRPVEQSVCEGPFNF